MYKKPILLFCVFVVVVSCYQYNKPKEPEHLISEQQMVDVLFDVKLISSITGKNKRVLDSANVTSQGYIQNKYGIDSIQFEENNAYYTYYVDDYQAIFTKVKDSFAKLKKEYESIVEEERLAKQKQDSLKKIEKELEKLEIEDDVGIDLISPVSDKD